MEKCFEVIDELIDEGVDVLNLRSNVSDRRYESIKRKLSRYGGGIRNVLINYGFFELDNQDRGVYLPTKLEIERCFYISHDYRVLINESTKELILDLYHLRENQFNKISKEIMKDLKKDALDIFYLKEFPENITFSFIRENRHLEMYINDIYGSLALFRERYGMSELLVETLYARNRGLYAKAGRIFEKLVKEVFIALDINFKYNMWVGDCRPDFIVGETWIDAKLRYNTVDGDTCLTIQKYLPRTDNLVIVYCFGEGPRVRDFGKNVTFMNIREFYSDLYDAGEYELVDQIEHFIQINEKYN